jgi:hypothetical protein
VHLVAPSDDLRPAESAERLSVVTTFCPIAPEKGLLTQAYSNIPPEAMDSLGSSTWSYSASG